MLTVRPSSSRARPPAPNAGRPAPAAAINPGLSAAALPIPVDLQARAGEAATLLKALAHPDRLLLLCHLLEGEQGVGELGTLAGVQQPSLSQQLGVLRGERLVATRREGKRILYRIASPAVLTLLQTLYQLFCAPTAAAPRKPRTATAMATARRTRKETP